MAIDLLKLQEKLGYGVNTGGMCYGIAYMAIQAIIRDDLETYISRIKYLEKTLLQHNNNQDDAIDEIVEKINVAYEKRKNKQNLDSEEIKLLDILNWLDGVQIYHNYKNLLFGGQNYEIATNFFSANTNQKEKENRKIFVIAKELNMLTKELINDIFDKIDNSKEPIAFSLGTPGHIISVGKSSNYMPIYLINHHIHKLITSSRSLYSEVLCAFKYSKEALNILTHSYQEENISVKYVTNNLDKDDLCKLLCIALQNGHPAAIKVYIESISNLRVIDMQELLAAKMPDGISGLYMALYNGHVEAIKVYIEGISNFDGIDKQELLAAKRSNGTPGLCMALQNGHSAAIKAYIEGISNLSGINKQDLLAAKMPNGTTGLFMVLQDGHAEAIKAYIEGISNFAGINKQELLAAKNQSGTPGLCMALQQGHAEAIKAYIEAIFNLPGINRRELLAAKTRFGTSGLHIALQQGHSEAVKAYKETISKFKILSNGLPGFLL
ncbi:hypothetical protein [Francisella hispaniensis]|uniref:Uncharacterized protein n=1 Tax=Francisella hispaniensis FSC454 TaxID=1088883 RepID=A0AAC9J5C6_9GAMM|nr:hypothetical protein [Francisella hispaniensis]APD50709.1 hypothetical protein FSC454_06110 [Francisella hispaniensis FSC454]